MPRRIRLATFLAFFLNGVLILTAQYRLSYDAYDHMFFGDHYRLDWWTLWDPRWYAGFEVTSYPPLVHQMIGLIGRLIGVDAAFAILLWAVLTAYPLAIYAFSRVFTGKTASGYAALGAAVLPSIYQAAHTFGQLPTLASGLFALFGLATLNEFLQHGGKLNGALTIFLFAAMMAAHHATLLFLPFIVVGLLIHLLLNKKIHWKLYFIRLAIVGLLSITAALVVIWPFWVWGSTQSLQVPIDHASRHNFFLDPFAAVVFFLPAYGPLIPLIPIFLWKGLRRKWLGLWAAFFFLFLLGLGGTTPLPRWLFGAGWEWLTYDRFALWASWSLLPFFGTVLIVFRRKTILFSSLRRLIRPVTFTVLGIFAIIVGLLPSLLHTQPPQIDMKPIVNFLAENDHSQWRYLTFGFGDQLAYLSLLTTATTIDGSYHTARSLPELRSSGLAQIDTAFWLSDGFTRLIPVLQKSGSRGVRWGFVDRKDFIPILYRSGWVYVGTLKNHVQVWENPQAVLPPPVTVPVETPFEQFCWGVFPLLALSIAGSLALLKIRPLVGRKILFGIHYFAIGLLPIGLCLWYYRTLFVVDHPRVYFTYDNALVFLSDALAAAAFLAWGLARLFGPPDERSRDFSPVYTRPSNWFFGLCLLASLSVFWSADWRTSAFISLQIWLVYGLFLSLQDLPGTWIAFALGGAAALFLEIMTGFWQFGSQSTFFLKPLGLNWPGNLLPTTQDASIVQAADGMNWLRVYGTLPHPNLLGGMVFVFLAVLAGLYLIKGRWPILILYCPAMVLLVMTFSRSAWLALAVFGLTLAIFSGLFSRERLLMLLLVTVVSIAVIFVPLRDLIFTRTSGSTLPTETFSIVARSWLAQQGLEFFREHLFSGLGIGSFIITLSQRAGAGYIIEPVHNIPLLVSSELGIFGLILLVGLVLIIFLKSLQNRKANIIFFFAILGGLFVIGLFDHYLWSLAPGRLLLGSMLGLWAGQVREN